MFKDFLQSTGRPHPTLPGHLKGLQATSKWHAPLLIPVAAMQKVNRSMNLINSMNVTSSHYLFMRKIIPFHGYLKWYLKAYPRWFTDRGLVVLLRLHQGFGSVCHSRGMQPTFLHHLPAGEVWDSCREKSDSFECWPYSIVTYLQQNFSTNFPQ